VSADERVPSLFFVPGTNAMTSASIASSSPGTVMLVGVGT
jgi:hypothetical protein